MRDWPPPWTAACSPQIATCCRTRGGASNPVVVAFLRQIVALNQTFPRRS